MRPLLDLYLELDNLISIEQYEKTLKEFVKLWGNDIHIFTNNINNVNKLEEFLSILKELDLSTYSFIDGGLTNKFSYIDEKNISILEKYGVNALSIIINEKLINEKKYINFINKILLTKLKLEAYFKVDENNVAFMDDVIAFCIKNNIKLCIIDIDKNSNNRICKERYREIVEKLLKINDEKKIKISIFECPYINIFRENILNIMGGCSAGITACLIDKEGYVVPCMYLKNIKIGNIKENSLENIWNSETLLKLANRDNISGKCSRCKYIKACGGCRAESYFKSKDLFKEDYNCWVEI